MHLNPRYLVIALLPLAVYILTDVFMFQLGLSNPIVAGLQTVSDVTPDMVYREAAIRYQFMATDVLFVAVSLITVGALIAELCAKTAGSGLPRYDPSTARMIGAALLVMLAIALGYFFVSGSERVHDRLGADLFARVLTLCTTLDQGADCLFGSARAAPFLPSGFDLVQRLGVIAALSGVAAAATGMILTLAQDDDQLRSLSRDQVFRLPRLFLYLTSTMFTVGMIGLILWMRFPEIILTEAAIPGYRALTSAMSLYYGIAYSVVIVSFYLPVVMILTDRIDQASAHGGGPDTAPTRPPAATADTLKIVEAGIAVMAPVIASLASGAGATAFAGMFGQ